MKKIITFIFLITLSSIGFSQTIIIADNNGNEKSVSNGQPFSLGNYTPGITYTLTVCSTDPINKHVDVFISSKSFPQGSSLLVYDGTSASGSPSAVFDHNTTAITVGTSPLATNSSGCLTLVFTSSVPGAHFTGVFGLKFICQNREVNIVSSNPDYSVEDNSKYVNVCWDYENQRSMPVELTAKGTYPTNTGYQLDDASVTYIWNFGSDAPQVGLGLNTISQTFSERKGYSVSVNTKDAKECTNNNSSSLRVRVARTPIWNNQETSANPAEICMGENTTVCSQYETKTWKSTFIPSVAEEIALPDGKNVCYSSPIVQNQFDHNAVVTDASDIKNICSIISHTHIGDLKIYIICPNGTTVQLFNQGGGKTHFGLPYQNIGYEYCWSNSASLTIVQYISDNNIQVQTPLPPGTFKPHAPGGLDALEGCPLNGTWTLEICDHWENDAGTNYGWHIRFADELYPEEWEYRPEYTKIGWSGLFGSSLNDPINDNCVVGTYNTSSTPDVNSIQSFIFKVEDNFGCFHDTAINVTVRNSLDPACCVTPEPNAGSDQQICGNLQASLNATIAEENNGKWELVSGPGDAQFQSITNNATIVNVTMYGEYTFKWNEYHKGNLGCTASDDIIIKFLEDFNPQISPIDNICVGTSPIQIQAVSFGDITCSPEPGLLDKTSHIFSPSIPGNYTIINTITNPCTGETITSTETFTVHDNINIVNHTENCIDLGTEQQIQISWEVKGSQGNPITNYNVNGVEQTSSNYSTTIASPNSYSFTVTDNNACSKEFVQGYRDCGCPLYAGTMKSLELVSFCGNECTSDIKLPHNGNQNAGTGGVFGYIIHKGDNIPIEYKSTPDFCKDNLEFNTIYYVSPVCGYADADNKPNLSGCYSISPGTRVRWVKSSSANAGDNQIICGLYAKLNASQAEIGYGYWTSTDSFVPINGTSSTSPNMEILVETEGEYTFTWNVENENCNAKDDIKITFIKAPAPNAGLKQIVCGNQAVIQATGSSSSGSTFSWSEASGNITFAPNDQLETTAICSQFGGYELILTENNNGCTGTSSVLTTFIEEPHPSINPGILESCDNVAKLSVITKPDAKGRWVAWNVSAEDQLSKMNPQPVFEPSATSPVAEVTMNYTETSKKVRFVWTERNTNAGVECVDSVEKIVVFAKRPIAAISGNTTITVCDNCVELKANTTGSEYATGKWGIKTEGEFTNPEGATSPNATFCIDPLTAFGNTGKLETSLYWNVSNPDAPSCSSSAEVNVIFNKKPKPIAGLDNSVCGNTYTLDATSDIASHSTGLWQAKFLADPQNVNYAATFTPNETSNNAEVTVTKFGVWQFKFIEINENSQSCRAADSVKIEFIETPVINAGPDFEVCGNIAELNATGGGFPGGSWVDNGAVTFADPTNPKTSVTSNIYGEIELIWQEVNMGLAPSSLSCSSQDAVKVTFYPKPEAKILSPLEDKVCGLTYSNLRAAEPNANLEGFWNSNSSGASYGNNTSFNTPVTVPKYGVYEFTWTLKPKDLSSATIECSDIAGPIIITFIEKPKANAGEDLTICGLKGKLKAIPTPNLEAKGIWTSPSVVNIKFEDLNSPTSEIYSDVYNTAQEPRFKIYWTEENNGCTDKDSLFVTFGNIPSSEFEIIPPKCFGESAIIKTVDQSLPQYNWDLPGGIVEKTFKNNEGGEHTKLVYWTDGKEEHEVGLTATNIWACTSTLKKKFTEPEKPKYSAKIIKDTCALKRGGIEFILEEEGKEFSFFWTDPNFGPSVGTSIPNGINNLPAGSYKVKTSYKSYNADNPAYLAEYIEHFGTDLCESLVEYTIPTIGMIKAKFIISSEIILEDLTAPEAKVVFLNKTDYDGIKKRCIWRFGDGIIDRKCDDLMEHTYTKAGCYYPELIVINKDLPECSDTAKLEKCIPVRDNSELEIPNVFSPNGDGINDYFQVKASSLREFNGVIVNRWGRTVYAWTNWQDLTAGWDGKLSSGNDASPGVYYYIITAEGLDGQVYEEKGALHLMRD